MKKNEKMTVNFANEILENGVRLLEHPESEARICVIYKGIVYDLAELQKFISEEGNTKTTENSGKDTKAVKCPICGHILYEDAPKIDNECYHFHHYKCNKCKISLSISNIDFITHRSLIVDKDVLDIRKKEEDIHNKREKIREIIEKHVRIIEPCSLSVKFEPKDNGIYITSKAAVVEDIDEAIDFIYDRIFNHLDDPNLDKVSIDDICDVDVDLCSADIIKVNSVVSSCKDFLKSVCPMIDKGDKLGKSAKIKQIIDNRIIKGAIKDAYYNLACNYNAIRTNMKCDDIQLNNAEVQEFHNMLKSFDYPFKVILEDENGNEVEAILKTIDINSVNIKKIL